MMWKLLSVLAIMANTFFITSAYDQCNTNHEYYDTCAKTCPPQTCESIGRVYDCPLQPEPPVCKGAWMCEKGYYRNKIGECISKEDCQKCNGPHEYYKTCVRSCPPQTCESIGKSYHCLIQTEQCEGGCVCEKGYYRNKIGECISKADCQKCTKKHEYFSCGPACDNVCATLSTQNQTHCPIVNIKCNPMCYCEKGYARDECNNCIPIKKCPPSCGGDPNAKPGCGVNCGRLCSNYMNEGGVACPAICYRDGCDCKENYVYDENLKKCVLPEDCTPICKANEVYDTCANGGCRKRKCSGPIVCVRPKKCEGGCICKEGYVKADNNTCILETQCPASCGGDPNARPGCGINCGRLCSNYMNKGGVACPAVCLEGGCDCKEDYVYDDNLRKCVLPKDCTPTCKENEVYSGCANGGCRKRRCSEGILCVDPIKCEGGCICKKGYVEGKNKTCIPESECPDSGQDNGDGSSSVNTTEAISQFNRGSIALSGEFIYQLSQSKPDENFVSSAVSILEPMALLALFAQNKVLQELFTLLNLDSKDQIKAVFPELSANYKRQTMVEFELVNKNYISDSYPITEPYKRDSERYFDASAQNVNFKNNKEAAKTINDWVSEKTRGKINNLISPDALDARTALVLVNALYFFGTWKNQFNEKYTEKRNFTKRNNEVVELDTMYQENNFNYAENTDRKLQVLEMTYKGGNFSLLVILPENFDETVQSLRNPNVFIEILNSLSMQKVRVFLPKMQITTSMDMKEMLQKDNVTQIFTSNPDKFTGILKSDDPLYVSAAIQKAFIKVDEKGTEAAAATGITGSATSAVYPPPQVFIFDADRPFIYFIIQKNMPLFCGAFVGGPLST